MFRFVFISMIALRVIMCPVYCAGSGVNIAASDVPMGSACHCQEQPSVCCGDDESPTASPIGCSPDSPCSSDTPCPCDAGCVCQLTPEANGRTVSADILLPLDLTLNCLETLGHSRVPYKISDGLRLQRFDLQCGRDIRLVSASLLL